MSRPVTIYAEMTPNPNTMKYVADHMLRKFWGNCRVSSPSDSKGYSTLADALFQFSICNQNILLLKTL
jgi:hypothetical protein